MTALLDRIRSRGYWQVRVMPTEFNAERRSRLADLEMIFREAHVELRGWDYPHEPKEGTTRANDRIEASVDWAHYHEIWRLYKSGQFVHLFGLREDWFKDSAVARVDIEPGSVLSLQSTLYSITEIFLFAARLTEKFPLGPDVIIQLRVFGLANRQLQTLDPGRMPLSESRRSGSGTHSFSRELTMSPFELIAHANDFAIDTTLSLYELFNWDPARQNLIEDQRRLLERRL